MRIAEFIGHELRNLPNRHQVAYAAACAEHGIGLFENFNDGHALRVALKLAWQHACGGDISPKELTEASEEVRKVVPHIDVDGSPEAHICMCAGVNVLETMNAILDGSPKPAIRSGLGMLATLTVALRISGNDDFPDFSDTNEMNGTISFPAILVDEWKLQTKLLEQLRTQKTAEIGEDLTAEHVEMGYRIQHWWRSTGK